MRSSQICVKCHLAILIMSLDQPVSCWREVLLSSLMMIAGNVRTMSQKLQPKNQNIVMVNWVHDGTDPAHQQILGRFEGEEYDESVGINFGG